MKTFVILAAGRGTRIGRVGEFLHKALVPLAGRAMISHILDLVPRDQRVVVALGHRGAQIREYLRLAHPLRHVEFVEVDGWDQPGGGPGASLLACAGLVEGDLYFTACDTLWARDESIWRKPESWIGTARMPTGTQPSRWCRVRVDDDSYVQEILDKTDDQPDAHDTFVGLGHVRADDLDEFWAGVVNNDVIEGERQMSSGFMQIPTLRSVPVTWTDVGDETAYRNAVARFSGYDWTKFGQATYILPEEGRIVKFSENDTMIQRRVVRGDLLGDVVPKIYAHGTHMIACEYVAGVTAYDISERDGTIAHSIVEWYEAHFPRVDVSLDDARYHAMAFYFDKTRRRVSALPPALRDRAMDAIMRVDWDTLAWGVDPGVWHGDLNYSNIIVSDNGERRILGIDWREDFDGQLMWGDRRYDKAKLLTSTVVHWQRAMRGDMRPWDAGPDHAEVFHAAWRDHWIGVIGALALLNSAPLHASPFDEVLVARGCAWLEDLGL